MSYIVFYSVIALLVFVYILAWQCRAVKQHHGNYPVAPMIEVIILSLLMGMFWPVVVVFAAFGVLLF